MARGVKLSPNVHSMYEQVFSWTTIVATCIVVDDAHCTISKHVGSTMKTPSKVWNPSLMINNTVLLKKEATSTCLLYYNYSSNK